MLVWVRFYRSLYICGDYRRGFHCMVMTDKLCYYIFVYVFVEWRVLRDYFNSVCGTLPDNYQLTIDKLKSSPQLLKNEGELLSKLISPSTDVRKINEKIITYLIVKLCYSGSSTDLLGFCDVMDGLIDSIETRTSVQQIRCGMYSL